MIDRPTGAGVLALSGGVGGAKLALGLADTLADGHLHVLVNTGDDFTHLGLHISPDIDTLLYTLSGTADPERGWGLREESWHAMEALASLGGDTWFRLGDRDLATHLLRSTRLAAGESLSTVTAALCHGLGVTNRVYPVSDDPIRTLVDTDEGELPFQTYFVRRRCQPKVERVRFQGIDEARPNPSAMALLKASAFARIVLCPSNPFVSVDPILQVPGLAAALRAAAVPVIAVSPIVGGRAIKGPAAKMMEELNLPVTAAAVAEHYQRKYPGLLTHFVLDHADSKQVPAVERLDLKAVVAGTVMRSRDDKRRLARFILELDDG